MSAAVVLFVPDPSPSLDVLSICDHIELQLPLCEDVEAMENTRARLSAVREYLEQTSSAGVARIQATRRRLEVRIGEIANAVGPQCGRHPQLGSIQKQRLSEMKRMADHSDVVERVIAGSDDDSPPSQRKVLREISKESHPSAPQEMRTASGRRFPEEQRLRIETIRDKASHGWTSKQIAVELNISAHQVRAQCRRYEIDLPADRVVGVKGVHIKSTRIMQQLALQLDAMTIGLDLVDADDVDDLASIMRQIDAAIRKLHEHLRRFRE